MCLILSGGITHTLLTCELILLACVKDLLYRLLSMTEVKRLLASLLSTRWGYHDFKRFPRFPTSLDASVCLVVLRLSTNNLVAEAGDYSPQVSFLLKELLAWTQAVAGISVCESCGYCCLLLTTTLFSTQHCYFRTQDYATSRTQIQAGFSHPRNILAYLRL